MKYVKENFYTLNFSHDIGLYINETKGYILELDGVLYGLAHNDNNSNRYILTHIETGLKIPPRLYFHKKTLEGFLQNLDFYNKFIDDKPIEYINEFREKFRKTLNGVQIDYNEYMQTLKDGWKYTVARKKI